MKTSLSSEGGIYHIHHIADAPQENWLRLCRDVTRAHRFIRQRPETAGYCHLTICEMAGNTPLRYDDSLIGLGVIAFNGYRAAQQAGDPFLLCRLRRALNHVRCLTYGHPYGFLVRVVLLLANHHCPNTWRIDADVPLDQWQQSLDWIAEYLTLPLSVPDNIKTTL
ncbi:hypothetical protein B4923_05265 [Brenneria roseae subsp. americana]|uniref:Uncharacterized protein n=1 Tax=Brenneria roseae subsp. americana TaxID=1508507 RepID=A0A2U1TY28_9GAMM|nr:hypothetical protein [Brenneria roseae]PWC14318.1 hypothetical protein B4923_05265 [Brenneria roseae subsp. americana]